MNADLSCGNTMQGINSNCLWGQIPQDWSLPAHPTSYVATDGAGGII